jgi:hypothetical protein
MGSNESNTGPRTVHTPPAWRPRNAGGGVHLEMGTVAMVISLGLLVAVTLLLRPPFWVVVVMGLGLPVLGIALRYWAVRRYEDVEQEFNLRMMSNDAEGMLRAYRKARTWSLFVPAHRTQSKLGLIYLMRERWKEAERVLEDAYEVTPPRLRSRLLGPLATAKFEVGSFSDLFQIASQWRERTPTPGPASAYLAAAMAETGDGGRADVEVLLREAGGSLRPREQRAVEHARRKMVAMS